MYYLQSRYYAPEFGRFLNPEPNVDYGEFDDGAGLYIVIDNITKEIIQVSNRFDSEWVVDVTIKLLKSDVFVK